MHTRFAAHDCPPRRSRWLDVTVVATSVVVASAVVGCTPDLSIVCGLSTSDPDVEARHLTATRDDGGAETHFDEVGAYSPGANATIVAGPLTLHIGSEETGTATDDLVARGVFPLCVPLGAASPQGGTATLTDESGVTSASDAVHMGGVALLHDDSGLIVGRFVVDLISADGTETSFKDGRFRIREQN